MYSLSLALEGVGWSTPRTVRSTPGKDTQYLLVIIPRDVLISRIYFWNETLHVSESSSVHHQEFFTVHTAMIYAIEVC